jgi:hypothetical protein
MLYDNQFGPLSEGKQAIQKTPYAQAVRKQRTRKAQGDGWPPEKHSRIISTVYSSEVSDTAKWLLGIRQSH